MSDRQERLFEREGGDIGVLGRRDEFESGARRRPRDFNEPICIHTNQVYDSCRDRDCIEDQRVYFTSECQGIIENAINIKVKSAEVIWIYSDVEEVPFNRGFFTVDIKYFFKVKFEVFLGVSNPVEVDGLCTFDKKVILFGSEGKAKIFTSQYNSNQNISQMRQKNNLPLAVVEVVDPVALSAKIVDCECCCCHGNSEDFISIPETICDCFDGDLVVDDDARMVLVTLGLFTIVKIERNVQLLINAVDFCIPEHECIESTEKNPCELFSKIRFPLDEFFPPQRSNFEEADSACGCKRKPKKEESCYGDM